MDPNRWKTVNHIFHAALEMPSSDRRSFVRSASNGDPDILTEVELLLEADQDAGSYLEQPLLGSSTPLESPPPVNPGDVLCGRFQILRLLGEGGMGHVFEALDSELSVNVALKVIRAEIASNPQALTRFRQEVRLARQITHPNVCRTFDIERQTRILDPVRETKQDIVFLTMEFLEGETLASRIRRDGPLPLTEALEIARQIADALQAAHKLGIVHRDMKPANIMLVPVEHPAPFRFRVVVTDFGLAQLEPVISSASIAELEPGVRPIGTWSYMAPEQLENGKVSPATDIFAFGLILFEMISGRRAFPSDGFLNGMAQRLTGVLPAIKALDPGVAPQWSRTIDECLRIDPVERIHSAAAVIAILSEKPHDPAPIGKSAPAIAGFAPSSIDEGRVRRTISSRSRRVLQKIRPRLAAVALIAVVAAALGVLAIVLRLPHTLPAHQGEPASPAFKILPVTSAPGEAEFPTFSPDGRRIAYLWDGPERNHNDVYVLELGTASPVRLTHTKSGVVGHPAWAPDGAQIAFSRCDGRNDGVFMIPSSGGAERKLTSAPCMQAEAGRVAWLPNGDKMLIVDRCQGSGPFGVVLFSPSAGSKRCLTNSGLLTNVDAGFDFALSPDGSTIAFTPAPPAMRCEVYTVPTGGGIPSKLTSGAQCWGEIMWSPDGQSILFSSTRTTLFTLCRVAAKGGPIEHEERFQQVGSLSKDGRHLVYSEQSSADGPDIWRADLASPGGPVVQSKKLIGSVSEEKDAQPSPDGSKIVWMSWRTGNAEIWTSGAHGEHQKQLTRLGTYSGTPRWSPDSKSIAFDTLTKNGTQIFVVHEDGGGLNPITIGPSDNVVPSWSQDGKSIYFASARSGNWQVWRHTLATGKEQQITNRGGFNAFESFDRRTLYFSKFDTAGVWKLPIAGGPESLLLADKPQFGFWGHLAVTRPGLYFLDADAEPRPRVEFYSFSTGKISPVFSLEKKPKRLQPGLSASSDGKAVYFTQYFEDDAVKMMEFSQ